MPFKVPQIVDEFDEAQRIIRSDAYVPASMANTYSLLAKKLQLDLEPTIRLLDVLPVFMHGDKHKAIRRKMAVSMAGRRAQQEANAQAFIAQLADLLKPGPAVDWMDTFCRPLWWAMNTGFADEHDAFRDVVTNAPFLFNIKTRLRDRLDVNERIRQFIALDEVNAEARLIVLAQGVLGMTPFVNSLTLSMHEVLSAHIGQPLHTLACPAVFPSSAVRSTDRYLLDEGHAGEVKRCVFHAPSNTPEQNNSLLYGAGEHVCLGRPLANAVWSMVTSKLQALPGVVKSSALTMARPLPQTTADYIDVIEPFQRPSSLMVELA